MHGDQPTAVDVVRARAAAASDTARARRANHRIHDPDGALDALRRSRITVNFHPDRRDRHGRTVAAGLLADGRYSNQYESGISNGGRFALAGGPRATWETALFGEMFETGVDGPIYGALDVTRDPHGGSPRFGSSYLVLRPACAARSTFTVGDSHDGPTDVGTLDQLDSILAGLLDGAVGGDGLDRGLTVDQLLAQIESGAKQPARSLDGYVEAQIHGGIDLSNDVARLVLDPSFRGTPVATDLTEAADRFGFELAWHRGSELDAAVVPHDFRGPSVAALARTTARDDGMVDAAAIGRALDDIPFTPPTPTGDPEDGPRQQYKKLWHCVLRFGSDVEPD